MEQTILAELLIKQRITMITLNGMSQLILANKRLTQIFMVIRQTMMEVRTMCMTITHTVQEVTMTLQKNRPPKVAE